MNKVYTGTSSATASSVYWTDTNVGINKRIPRVDLSSVRLDIPLNPEHRVLLQALPHAECELEQKAIVFAYSAHSEQERKYTGDPYLVHLFEVARYLHDYATFVSQDMIAAAWLHDVVEDTAHDIFDISDEFGSYVAELVQELTDSVPLDFGNRQARKAKECLRLASVRPASQTIKLADMLSNTSSILAHDPKFAKVYIPECRALHTALTKGDKTLRELLDTALTNAEQQLLSLPT